MNIPEQFQKIVSARDAKEWQQVRELSKELREYLVESDESLQLTEADLLSIPVELRKVAIAGVAHGLLSNAIKELPQPELPAEFLEQERALIKYLNDTPLLLSLLYDLNLLPEVISTHAAEGKHRNSDWRNMLIIIMHFKECEERAAKQASVLTQLGAV